MIAHLDGKLSLKTPAFVIIDCDGVGYQVNISLHTFDLIGNDERIKLHTHLVIKEDSHILYGFAEEEEKQLFVQLISVSGVGPNTARLMLSSLHPTEIREAIIQENWALIKTIKGIGEKTAQKVVIDLKNKIKKMDGLSFPTPAGTKAPAVAEEALAALVMLGFSKSEAEKGIQKVRQQHPDYSIEDLVKHTLKII